MQTFTTINGVEFVQVIRHGKPGVVVIAAREFDPAIYAAMTEDVMRMEPPVELPTVEDTKALPVDGDVELHVVKPPKRRRGSLPVVG